MMRFIIWGGPKLVLKTHLHKKKTRKIYFGKGGPKLRGTKCVKVYQPTNVKGPKILGIMLLIGSNFFLLFHTHFLIK